MLPSRSISAELPFEFRRGRTTESSRASVRSPSPPFDVPVVGGIRIVSGIVTRALFTHCYKRERNRRARTNGGRIVRIAGTIAETIGKSRCKTGAIETMDMVASSTLPLSPAPAPTGSRSRGDLEDNVRELMISDRRTEPALRSYPAPVQPHRPRPTLAPVRMLGKIPARSARMLNVFEIVERLTATSVTVTLLGETGTGKDVLAHALHEGGPRRQGPFVVFDCASVPTNLVESEMFGHERGSFTGAHAEHAGAFERAQGGTLFLDEIGELPIDLQPRLLRALDGQAVRRVGGTRDRRVDVRVIAATNRDLAGLVATRHFRQDLYFRLAAATIELPALRDRVDDLPLLVQQLLSDLGRSEVTTSEAAFAMLRSHSWPGNVRELKNALSYALAFVDASVLEPWHFRFAPSASEEGILDRLELGGHSLQDLERAAIRQTMHQARGNKTQAARVLGIAPSTLYEKLQKYRR